MSNIMFLAWKISHTFFYEGTNAQIVWSLPGQSIAFSDKTGAKKKKKNTFLYFISNNEKAKKLCLSEKATNQSVSMEMSIKIRHTFSTYESNEKMFCKSSVHVDVLFLQILKCWALHVMYQRCVSICLHSRENILNFTSRSNNCQYIHIYAPHIHRILF